MSLTQQSAPFGGTPQSAPFGATPQSAPFGATRTPTSSSSSGISAQLVRLLPPLGCPGQPLWVPPNEVQRWEQLGFGRAPIPAADLELNWQPAGQESGGLIPIELLLNPRLTPPNAVTLVLADDGCGFDPEEVTPHRYGLAGMNERVKLLGGELTIESAAGVGTVVRVVVPLLAGL